MSKSEDIALISKVLSLDDKRAFDHLTIKYQSFVRRFLLHLTQGDTMLADDLAQETFIKAYLNLGQFQAVSHFSTWLTRIAYNVFYDNYRKETAHETENIDRMNFELEDQQNSTKDIDVEYLIKNLKPDEKAVVLLFYMEDFEIKKIAKVMNISVNSVKSLLFRARQKMKQQYGKEIRR
ncbi:RNA polymerase sigma factor [Bacteroidia bacterium]|nr:RNA polymerase sigma factor [Bacteroidia bacterium]